MPEDVPDGEHSPGRHPVTVAGPQRICTALPY
ncbi:hypothetical protein M2105_004614 [Paenibacillus sp. PastF-1]|nr:hypothetical protein [Paenibacillus sp. PastF-1]MDH6482011.1 hypothetical protein [Paenibacillus sp. PastH-2]